MEKKLEKKFCKNCIYIKKGSFQYKGKIHDYCCEVDYPPSRYVLDNLNKKYDCEFYKEFKKKESWFIRLIKKL